MFCEDKKRLLFAANLMVGANKVCFGVCRLWRLTLMIQPCMQREAFAGCI
jgi:hypothetical protein